MMFAALTLMLAQDPAPNPPTEPSPPTSGTAPARTGATRDRLDDRLESRLSGGEGAADPQPEIRADEPPRPLSPAEIRRAEGWQSLNRCALVVNEEPVTLFAIQRGVIRSKRERRAGPEADNELVAQEITNQARTRLEIQGGKDLGFDPAQIVRIVDRQMKRQEEDAGSVTRLAEGLRRGELDSFDRRHEIETRVHAYLWEESVTGRGSGPGGRISRDRYIRPGRAWFDHREAEAKAVLNRSVQVTQIVLLLDDPPAPGGEQRLIDRLTELRGRIEAGEDMGELAELYGSTDRSTRGLSRFLALGPLGRIFPEVAKFLSGASVGELSPPLPYRDPKDPTRVLGYVMVRPEEYRATPPPAFDQAKSQTEWIDGLRTRLDDERIDAGLAQLLQAAFVWPEQTFSGPRPTDG